MTCRIRLLEYLATIGVAVCLISAARTDYKVHAAELPNYLSYQAMIEHNLQKARSNGNADGYFRIEAMRDDMPAPLYSYQRLRP